MDLEDLTQAVIEVRDRVRDLAFIMAESILEHEGVKRDDARQAALEAAWKRLKEFQQKRI